MTHDFEDYGLGMMPWGVDPETGYPLYILTQQRFAVVLPRCDGCGKDNVISAPLGKGPVGVQLCYACLMKLQNFRAQRGRLNKWSTEKALDNYYKRLQEYLDAKEAGLWVPHDLSKYVDKYSKVASFITERAYQQRMVAEKAKRDKYGKIHYCSYCGRKRLVKVRNENTSCYICEECDVRRSRYENLIKRHNKLTLEECQELNDILDTYVKLSKQDNYTPNVPVARAKVNKRLEALNEEKTLD